MTIQTRSLSAAPSKEDLKGIDTSLGYRAFPLAKAPEESATGPGTLDEATRSVEVIAATEQPVMVMDWERWEPVAEILLMSGCRIPDTGQIPLLDTHRRYDTSSVIGSCRGLRIEGSQLVGRAHYSSAEEAEGPYLKMKEGHLTDYSVGYRVEASTYIAEGQTGIVAGRKFEGPVKIATDWIVKELSACPIGADDLAKARAATPPETKRKETKPMDARLRKYLESRGLSTEATEEQALAFLEGLDMRTPVTPPAKPAGQAVAEPVRSEDEIRREIIVAEQARISDIRGLCDKAGIAERAQEFITGNKTVETVRQIAFDHLVSSSPEPTGYRKPIEMGVDERDKFRAAAEGAILLRAGQKVDDKVILVGARDLAGFSLREMAREACRMAGISYSGDVMEMVGRSLTSSDLPSILANVANKSLFIGYETADETWQEWVEEGSAVDFKTHDIPRASETDDLDQILEDGEYKYGKLSDSKESYKLATYGKLCKISRTAIVNDDLSALTDIPKKHGEAAARKVGDVVYAVLTANAAMGDGVALFHATHANLGTAGVISEATTAEAIKLMKLQKDIGGKRRLNIRAEYFLAPAALEGSAEVFFNSNQFAGANTAATRSNPYAGTRFARIYDARLDDASASVFYFAGPKGKTIKVFFLNGNKTPYLETRQGWSVDGVEMKVRHDVAAKAVDWRAMIKMPG